MSNQKKDLLSKYLPKKASANANKPLPQLKIIDPDLAFDNNSSQDEEEVPTLFNPQGLALTDFQAKTLVKKGMLEADFLKKIENKEEPNKKQNKVLIFIILTHFPKVFLIEKIANFRQMGQYNRRV